MLALTLTFTLTLTPACRFAPVKKCSDLMTLRSDAFVVAPDKTLMLNPRCTKAPVVDLDSKLYKTVQQVRVLACTNVGSFTGRRNALTFAYRRF